VDDNVEMFVRVWEYDVLPARIEDFERAYRGDGPWAGLFSRADDFVGTELFRSTEAPQRYLTVDRFGSEGSWQAFRRDHAADYQRLDDECAGLTAAQRELAP
jgi:heme-degrading monooxygenase HmoA